MSVRRASQMRAFGKLPFAGEFVRLGSDSDLGERFAEWLDQGMGFCHETPGYVRRHDPNTANGISFFFPSDDVKAPGYLVGNMLPSEDRFGRQFPFTVVSENRAVVCSPSVLPISAYRFVHESAGACLAASAEALGAHLSPVVPMADSECDRAAAAFEDWTHQPDQLGLLLGDMFPTESPGGPAFQAVTAVRFLAQVVYGVVSRRTPPRCVRLPVGDGSGGFAPAFWLEAIHRLSGGALRPPAAFWSTASARGVLLAQLGALSPTSFGRLWGDIPDDTGLVDLSMSPLPSALSLPELPPNVSISLLDQRSNIATFFAALDSIAAV